MANQIKVGGAYVHRRWVYKLQLDASDSYEVQKKLIFPIWPLF